ncbi:MAG TPA: PEP-CTERM sorting domain-containing protein [Fimbriimonadales bacterium]|nr:PEP-CTERM sorting domain-containing protein [Fimbriimonadales bacterium]
MIIFSRGGFLAFALGWLVRFAWCQPIVSDLNFYQVDWDSWAGGSQSNSLWGGFSFSYIPDEETYYLNLSLANSMDDEPAWVTQNLPLFGIEDGYEGEQSLSIDINLEELDFTVGTDWQSTFFYVSVTPDPLSDTPTGTFEFADVVDTVWKFDDPDMTGAGHAVFNPGAPAGHKAQEEASPIGPPRKMNTVEERPKHCMAGAFARSLDWLNREYKLGVDKDAQKIYKDLVKAGVAGRYYHESENEKNNAQRIVNKAAYSKRFHKGMTTKIWDYPGNAVAEIKKGTLDIQPEEGGDVTKWLAREFENGEDIELGMFYDDRGHMVTVTGLYMQDGKTVVQYMGDPNQEDSKSGNLIHEGMIEKEKSGKHELYYLKGKKARALITMAVSESVPEPATVVIIGGGITYLALRQRKARRRHE